MKIISLTFVKDGSDIIESFIRYHANIFDEMIILYNSSDDNTLYILSQLLQENYPLILINNETLCENPIENYNILLNKGFDEYNADIICLLDVDEFLTCERTNPKNILKKINLTNCYMLKQKTYIPTNPDNDKKFVPSRVTHVRDENLDNFYNIIITKELFVNHKLTLNKNPNNLIRIENLKENNLKIMDKIEIAYFPVRSINQFFSKIINGDFDEYIDKFKKDSNNLHFEELLLNIKKKGKINLDELTNFAKYYDFKKNQNILQKDIKIYKKPLNLDFCKNIEIRYNFDVNINKNILKIHINMIENIKKLKKEKETYVQLFEKTLTLFKKNQKIIRKTTNGTKINLKKINTLIKLNKKDYKNLTISIKSPNPTYDKTWGDYFFAKSLKKSFDEKGFNVIIHEREQWDDENSDIVIVLRGKYAYTPKPQHLNLMWNISHPNMVSLEEYNKYDCIFVASNKYYAELSNSLTTLVKPLLQCTDPNIFYYKYNDKFNEEILFVGITRNVYRTSIKDILKTKHDFAVYGRGWEEYIDKKHIKGEFIPNNILNQAYSSCKILLNDHWSDMKEKGFISNRIFDALACQTFIISDNNSEVNELFEGNVVIYDTYEDLDKKITYYLENEDKRKNKAKQGQKLVLKFHTFDNRVEEILSILENEIISQLIDEINTEIILNNTKYINLIYEYQKLNIEIAKLNDKNFFLEQKINYLNKKIIAEDNMSKNKSNLFKYFRIK